MNKPILFFVAATVLAAGGVAIWYYAGSQSGKIGGEAVTLFESHGNWETLCDEISDKPETARCYVRLVDVYSQRPDFGAYVGFITPQEDGDTFQMSLEPGSVLSSEGLSVVQGDDVLWTIGAEACSGNVCVIKAKSLAALLSASESKAKIRVQFQDKHGKVWQRELSGEALSKAYRTYRKAVDTRLR